MAAIKFKTARGVERGCEEGFGGIDDCARGRSGTNRCSLIENLDLSEDGSLVTRSGYEHKYSFPARIRGTLNTSEGLYVAAGSTLYFTDTKSSATIALCSLPSETDDVDLFFMNDTLHILDGSGLYRLIDSTLSEVEGYAPLYGINWDPKERGEVYEDFNVVSNRLRINYILSEESTVFDLGLCATSIDRVEINGKNAPIDRINCSFDNDEQSVIEFRGIDAGSEVTFFITLAEGYDKRNFLKKPSKAFIFTSNGGERLCIYHPGVSNSILCSRVIDKESYYNSRKTAKDSLSLYLPISSCVAPGNGSSVITGMAHHYDRALLFTESDTWCVDFEGKEPDISLIFPKLFLLNSSIGSEIILGDAHCGNDPLSFYRGGIWRWHSQSGIRDECSASIISNSIASLLPKDPDKILMMSIPHKEQVWLADTEDSQGKMIIFNTSQNAFTVWSGIFAESLIHCGKNPAFTRDGEIYVLNENLSDDLDNKDTEDIIPIKTRLVSHFCDFGTPEREKRSMRVIIDTGGYEGELTLTLENEKGEIRSFSLKSCSNCAPINERIILPRFRKIKYSVSTRSGKLRLRGIILSAK